MDDTYPNLFNLLTLKAQEVSTQTQATVWGMPIWVSCIVIAILLLVSGLFSASENAFSNCNRYHFKVLADEGKLTPRIIVFLTKQFDSTLVAILVGNNIVQTLMSFITAVIFYNILTLGYQVNDAITGIVTTVVMAFLVYIISDTCPKILSKLIPNRMCYILAWPVYIVYILLYPIIWLFSLVLKAAHKIFKIKDDNIFTKEDFIEIADEAVNEVDSTIEDDSPEEELFEPNELKILNNAFLLNQIPSKKVFTPLDKIKMINIKKLNAEYINDFIMNNHFSRYPVFDKEPTNIVGIFTVNTYFYEYSQDKHIDIRSILHQPIIVKEDETVDKIFKKLNKEKNHIALVTNNENKLTGMITMSDILEELVNESVMLNPQQENNLQAIGESND